MNRINQDLIANLISAIRIIETSENIPERLSVLRSKDERRRAKRRVSRDYVPLACVDQHSPKMLE